MKFISPIIITFFAVSTCCAQVSPPLGPPSLPMDAQSADLPIGMITNLIKTKLTENMAVINHRIDSLSASNNTNLNIGYKIESVMPSMKATEFINMPNSNYVRVLVNIKYSLTDITYRGVPYFSRNLYQEIALNISCRNWQSDNGLNYVILTTKQPVLDDASFGEQVLNFFLLNTLTNLVNSQIKQSLGGTTGTSILPFYNSNPCNCLRLTKGVDPMHEDGFISVYKMPVPPASDAPTVFLRSIKRLKSIEDINPRPATQTVNVEYHVNFRNKTILVENMREEEVRTFSNISLQLLQPNMENGMVVIANIAAPAGGEPAGNSNFLYFKKGVAFPGKKYKLIVNRSFMVPASIGHDGRPVKPYKVSAPDYELEFEIRGNSTKVLSTNPTIN
jgi:hypothetical protein